MSSGSASAAKSTAIGNVLWQKQPKANAELFALTYGALVGELLRDLERSDAISSELDRMGHSMGIRSIEEFLAKIALSDTPIHVGNAFTETPETIRMALRMFFGINADCRWKENNANASAAAAGDGAAAAEASSGGGGGRSTYSLFFTENPLTLFVELPEDVSVEETLEYNQLLAGWCRGVLEMLQFDCTCKIQQSILQGDTINEISITLNQILQEGAGEDYQEE